MMPISKLFLLIEPLWNWNSWSRREASRESPTFNRTTMELKRAQEQYRCGQNPAFNRTTMELKHEARSEPSGHQEPFNRTTMELKLEPNIRKLGTRDGLLIEPLWNWNRLRESVWLIKQVAFNRTTMELKPMIAAFVNPVNWPFNRTTMELKLVVRLKDSLTMDHF